MKNGDTTTGVFSNVGLIARRELEAYLRTMLGYIIVAGLLLVDGLLFQVFALEGEKLSAAVLSRFFENTGGVTMVAGILLSMRLIAEERQTGTLVLLTSSPVRDWEVVLGKYLSALTFLGIFLALTLYMPVLVMVNGKISWGHVAAGYLGLFLLGSAALSIGVLGSALAKNQLLAGLISTVILVSLLVAWMLARVTERPFNTFFADLALWHRHFTPFMDGIVHLRDVVYYGAVTYFMLFSATRVLEARRWR